MSDVKIGHKVRCVATGYTGVVCSMVYRLSGTIQANVMPQADGSNKLETGWYLDIEQLEVLDEGHILDRVVEAGPWSVELGQKVKDEITSEKGCVTDIVEHLNGCITCTVTLPGLTPEGRERQIYVDHKRLKPLDQPKADVKQARTGCAPVRAPRSHP